MQLYFKVKILKCIAIMKNKLFEGWADTLSELDIKSRPIYIKL